ncbi:MAG: enoyl-CoA hydratase/isomerase family protein, partial [Chloroflexi bacterium]|nr:enoyl-CoA hydratase/isomerase family protein [Chloroflexota bacterium]
LEIALACDLRFAGDGKFFMGLPEATLGLLPGNGGTQRLSRLIGAGPALELMLTGRTVAPQEAYKLGIINNVFPAESLLNDSKAYALKMATGPTKALGHIKRCVFEGIEKPLADGLTLERELIAELFTSEDAIEGLTAFVEKRKPEFKGK